MPNITKPKLWTVDFIPLLADEIARVGGNISLGCRNLGRSPSTFYSYLNAAPGNPVGDKLKEVYPDMMQRGLEALVDEAKRRAFIGENEPVVFQGQFTYMVDPVTTEIVPVSINKKSDKLLQFLISNLDSRFGKNRLELTGPGGGPILTSHIDFSQASDEDLDAIIKMGKKLAVKVEDAE